MAAIIAKAPAGGKPCRRFVGKAENQPLKKFTKPVNRGINQIDKERADHRHNQNALCDAPKVCVTDCIFATAVGVAPKPKPQW